MRVVSSSRLTACAALALAASACGDHGERAGPRVRIAVGYAGASPAEVEQSVVAPLERALSALPRLRRLEARADEGQAALVVDFAADLDEDAAAVAVREALAPALAMLPREATPPAVSRGQIDGWVYAEVPLGRGEQARRVVEVLAGVRVVERCTPTRVQVAVRLRGDKLSAAGLTADAVHDALARAAIDVPGGRVDDPAVPRIRVGGAVADPAALPVDARGTRLADVADLALEPRPTCLHLAEHSERLRIGLVGSRGERARTRARVGERLRPYDGHTIEPGVTVGLVAGARAELDAWARPLDAFAVALAEPGQVMVVLPGRDPRALDTARQVVAAGAPPSASVRWVTTAAPLWEATLVGADRAALVAQARAAVEALDGQGALAAAGCPACATRHRLQLDVDRDRAATLGVAVEQIRRTLAATAGEVVATWRSPDGDVDLTLEVQDGAAGLSELPLAAVGGVLVRVGDVTRVSEANELAWHLRVDGRAAVTVWAQGRPGTGAAAVKAALARALPGARLAPADLDRLVATPWAGS